MAMLTRRKLLGGKWHTPDLPIVRLPWVIDDNQFIEHCSRCYQCITNCPMEIIIKGNGGFPQVDFQLGECLLCGKCVEICQEQLFDRSSYSQYQSKAIPLNYPWHHRVTINSSCLTHQGVTCRSCQDSCEQQALSFKLEPGITPQPQLVVDACNGCGACIKTCPVGAIIINENDYEQ